MDNKFIEAYVHLEKLCSDMYGDKYGVSKYIEDMEKTSTGIQTKIIGWDTTYKKLKDERWKRNQLMHYAQELYDDSDTEWLIDFYQKIMDGEDPLSKRRKLLVTTKKTTLPSDMDYMRKVAEGRTEEIKAKTSEQSIGDDYEVQNVGRKEKVILVIGIIIFIGILVFGIMAICEIAGI